MARRGRNKEERIKVSKESWKNAFKVFRYMKPYRFVYSLGLIALIISSASSMMLPYLLGNMLGFEKGQEATEFSLLDTNNLNALFALLIILFVVQAIFSFFRIYLFTIVTESSLRDLRRDAFQKLITSPIAFFDKNKVGELQSRISTDVTMLTDTFNTTIAEFLRQIITIVTGVVFIAYLSPKLALIMLSIIPVVAISAVIFGKFIKKFSKKAQDAVAESNGIILDALSGIKNVKSFVNEKFELFRYGKSIDTVRSLGIKGGLWRGVFASFIILVMFGSVIVVIWQGMKMVQLGPENGGMDQKSFFQFILFTIMLGASFGGVSGLFGSLQKAVGATERLLEIIEQPTESFNQDYEKIVVNGHVAFKDVHFSYDSRADLPVLDGINFEVKAGELAALVGSSGAGKSTIASLLLRFYDVNSGTLTLDGKSVNEYGLSQLRDQMAIVPQDVILFGGTIKENIGYGNVNASEEEIIEAAKKANALEFINKFPDKLETLVGDRGIQLSGGQRQRIAIARAVLKDPKILILDEATSSLDSESESLVQEALERLMKGRTSFVIAHRLSTIRNADKIMVLENGKIKESGTHDELIALQDGLYSHLSKLQFEV